VFVNGSCFVDINAEVLLHFVLMMQTRPFTMQVASVVFSEMSPICHQFRLVLLLRLPPAYSVIASNVNCCTEPLHALENCRDWTRYVRKMSPEFAMTFHIRTELAVIVRKHAIFQWNPIGTKD